MDDTLKTALTPFGQIIDVQKENWARTYRYAVDNGIRQVAMVLTKHVPSHLIIAEQRVLISYDGQPTTCYGCGKLVIYIQCAPEEIGGINHHPSKHRQRTQQWQPLSPF